MNSGGQLDVRGGVANSTTVNSRGNLYIYSGGVANLTTVSGGRMYVYSGGVALDVVWTPCVGNVTVYEGATVTFVSDYQGVYFGSNGRLLSSAMTMEGKKLSGHSMYVMNGGVANSTTVNSYGYMYVSSGGVANSTNVNSGGSMLVRSGGVANLTNVNSVGFLFVSNGGVANKTTASGWGSMYVSNGGVANKTTVNSVGFLFVSNGGVANSTTVNSDGYLLVSSGGTANSTNVNSRGYLDISSGGVANSTAVNSYGRMCVSSGGVANSTTVNSRGSMYVFSGGKVTGMLTLASGAVVLAYAGGIIDFDVSRTSANDTARVNDLSLIQGAPDYTITVSASQAPGEYRLADGAAGFDRTVTVTTDTAALGTLSVGGTITVDNVDYSLKLANGALSLGVAFKVEPSGSAGALTSATATQVYGADLAARWTSDTAAPGSVTLVTSDFGGDVWLDIDGVEVEGAIYGASCAYSGTVNIDAKSGSIRNLAAGAADGGSVGAVKLNLEGADLAGVAYAGGFGNVAGEVDTVITSGTFAKDFYAGALARRNVEATGIGDVNLTIVGGTFSGNIYGASAVKTDAAKGNGTRHTVGDVTLTITGGETAKGAQACIFAGGYATGDATGTVYTVESVTATISGGNWGTEKIGRGVFGGIMASEVAAQAGDVNLTVSGGSMGNVYGGGWAQQGGTSIVGNVDITIAGDAEIANVYGGGSHSTSGGTTSVENVNITVAGGNITGAIYTKGQADHDVVNGNANVIFTGATGFDCDVYGYSYVSGEASDATLSFSGYTGAFSGRIGGFDGIVFDASTSMTLTTAAANVSNSEWNFDMSARAATLAGTALLDWDDADFAGDSITLNLASGSTAAWTLVDAATTTVYGEFEVLVDGVSQGTLALGEQLAYGEFAGWGFTNEDAALKFKQLA